MRSINLEVNYDGTFRRTPYLRQGETGTSTIYLTLPTEFQGYSYVIVFQPVTGDPISTEELTPDENQIISYVLTAVFTAEIGTIGVELTCYDESDNLVKSAEMSIEVKESLSGAGDVIPTDYVPWYVLTAQKASEAEEDAEYIAGILPVLEPQISAATAINNTLINTTIPAATAINGTLTDTTIPNAQSINDTLSTPVTGTTALANAINTTLTNTTTPAAQAINTTLTNTTIPAAQQAEESLQEVIDNSQIGVLSELETNIKTTLVGAVNEVSASLKDTKEQINTHMKKINIYDTTKFIPTEYYDVTVGTHTDNDLVASSNWNSYGVYEVSDGEKIIISCDIPSNPRINLYDTDGILRESYRPQELINNTLKTCSVSGYTIKKFSLSIPLATANQNNVAIIIVDDEYYTESPSTYIQKAKSGYRILKKIMNLEHVPLNVLNSKTIYAFGDSITYGVNNNGVSHITKVASNNDMTLSNGAISGATFVKTWYVDHYRSCILEQIDNAPATVPDYILLSGGYNDGQESVLNTIGTIEVPSASKTIECYNMSGLSAKAYTDLTFCEAVEYAIYKIKQKYPTSKILAVITYKETTQYHWESMYVPALRNIYAKWSIPVVDFTVEGGLVNCSYLPERTNIFTDNVHPNDIGYTIMSEYVEAKLRTI